MLLFLWGRGAVEAAAGGGNLDEDSSRAESGLFLPNSRGSSSEKQRKSCMCEWLRFSYMINQKKTIITGTAGSKLQS